MDARKNVFTVMIIAVLSLVACQPPRQGTPPWEPLPYTPTPVPPVSTPIGFDRETEERAVYEALLSVPDEAASLVILDTTASYGGYADDPDEYYEYITENTAGVSPELWVDFVAANEEQKPFPADLNSGGAYTLISRDELNAIFNSGDYSKAWNTFRDTYDADAYGDYSRVGFSPAPNSALVYTGTHCGDLCGSGILILLEKQAGEWRTVSHVMTWIS